MALVMGSLGWAAPLDGESGESFDRSIVGLEASGELVARVDGAELRVRMLGVGPIDANVRQAAEGRLIGPISLMVRPDGSADAQGVPLVELFRDGRSLNEELIALGLARTEPGAVVTVPPRILERLWAAETRARVERRGIWADPDPPPSPTPTPTPVPEPSVATVSTVRVRSSSEVEPDDWRSLESLDGLPPRVRESSALPLTTTAGNEPPSSAVRDWPAQLLSWPDPLDGDAWLSWVLGRSLLALLGIWVSSQKRRRPIEGVLLCGGLGVLGVFVTSCLPATTAVARVESQSRSHSRSRSRSRSQSTNRGTLQADPERVALPSWGQASQAALARLPSPSKSPLAEFVAATSSGSMLPLQRETLIESELAATSDGAFNSADLVIRPGTNEWDDELPTPHDSPGLAPFWSEWDDAGASQAEPPSTASTPPGDPSRAF